jgi:acyl-CoA reductase-like NAD-dependent aldehyde dehydrogenase
MQRFTLLVNGTDLDTGRYEYFPYADKSIADPKNTYKTIVQFKKGEAPPNYEQYIYARYCIGDDETNKKAIEAAYNASSKFRYFPVSVRRKILGDIHKNLVEKKDELLKILIAEGHPRQLSEWELSCMEMGYRKETLDFFKDELWTEIAKQNNETIYVARKPDGVVCVSPPRNAPCSNSLTAGYALLGGNTIVIKPPLRNPLSTIYLWKEIVWKAVKDNKGPDGTINIVIGNSKKITEEWLVSPYVNDILYFGDSKDGLEIGQRIFQAGKKPILELSGNDMMFIWKDADLDGAIDSLLDAFLGSTQICMVPKKAIIHEAIYDELVKKFIIAAKKLKVGLPSDPETRLTPVILIKDFYEFFDDAKNKGAKLAYGGERVDYKGNRDDSGIYIKPTIILVDDDKKAMQMRCMKEENFFPLLPLVKAKGSDEEIFEKMVNMANSNEFGLRISVWVSSNRYIRKFIRFLNNCGLLRINAKHVGFSLCLSTHGGTGKTGGPYGEMNYMWQKTTHLQGISLIRRNTKE